MPDNDEDTGTGQAQAFVEALQSIHIGDPPLGDTRFYGGTPPAPGSGPGPKRGYNSLKGSDDFVPDLQIGGGFRQSIGNGIGDVVAPYAQEHLKYVWGGKSRAAGGFDCSGLVHQVVMPAFQGVNQKTGGNVYDIAHMNKLLDQPAAYQIASVAAETGGGFIVGASNIDQLRPGMMLGVTRNNIPDFAKGRPEGISHIGVIVMHNNQMMVAESGNHGVAYTPVMNWLMDPSIAHVHAVDPFAITNQNGRDLIAKTFGDEHNPALVTTPPANTNTQVASGAAAKPPSVVTPADRVRAEALAGPSPFRMS